MRTQGRWGLGGAKGVASGGGGRRCVRREAAGDFVVAGDIGGTNARFQLWQLGKRGTKELVLKMKYPTADFKTFVDALLQFDTDCKYEVGAGDFRPPQSSAFAAAGVVIDNRLCSMTNLDWTLCSSEIREKTSWKHARILNDFEAVGYGVLAMEEEDKHVVHGGSPQPKGPKVVLGPGTGFGQAQLFWNEKKEAYTVMPSEGAHGDFGPRGAKQRKLSEFVEKKMGYCELEHVCCGPGLENIYEFLSTEGRGSSEGQPRKRAPEISEAALGGTDDLAVEAVELLLTILGQEAGNWGLRSLARGGVYIAGGITPKLLPILENGCLKKAFLHKESRFTKVLESVPLTLVTTDDIGLAGSCLYASRALS